MQLCSRYMLVAIAAICLAASPPLHAADDAAALADALQKPILDSGTPQREVEAFCEARVLRMPAADSPERQSAEAWQKYSEELRQKVLANVVFRGEMANWRDAKCQVQWLETIEGGDGYRIKKLRMEAVPGLWVPALLYEPIDLKGKMPVFLNVNGHDSAGKAAGYKQIRCINQAKRGIISLNLEWYNMGQLRGPGFAHYKLNQLDLCGTSGVGLFYLAMKRGLDVLLAHKNADPSRVGVAGLSGGGWQTIFISSLDTRVTLANPVAGYSSFLTRIANYSDLGDSEQTPCDLAQHADYAHLTALLAPRVALLTYNEKDNCCFAAPHALAPLLDAARPIYKLLGNAEALHDHVNYDPGTHNFERDNREAHYRVLKQHWFADQANISAAEIDCASEVKKSDELAVELPEKNLDFQKLAEQLMADLPSSKAPKDAKEIGAWQKRARAKLLETLRIDSSKPTTVKADKLNETTIGQTEIKRWKLRLGADWTLPAVELVRENPRHTSIVIADGGRAKAGQEIDKLLTQGHRVIAVDPFYFGESKIKNKDFLFALLVSSVGERPLGIQASQLQQVARWLQEDRGLKDVGLCAFGPRTSLIALAAAASDEAVAGASLHNSLGSLKEVIEQGGSVNQTPEQFCFGLLQTADILELAGLVAPREIRFVDSSERAEKELAGLKDQYQQLGSKFDPLAP